MSEEDEFMDGYRDGRDLNCPEPSANRSHSYRQACEFDAALGGNTDAA